MATEHKTDAARNVEDRLKTLYKLQLLHSQIRRIRAIRGELPQEVKDLSDTIKGLSSRIERYQGEIQDLRAKTVDEKNKIENKKLLIDRYKEHRRIRASDRQSPRRNRKYRSFYRRPDQNS